ATVVELCLHHRGEHAAPAMGRQHADDGDTGGRDLPAARHRHAIGEGACAADDLVAVERRMHSVDIDPLREALGVLGRALMAEIVADRVDRLAQLLHGGAGPYLDIHFSTLTARAARTRASTGARSRLRSGR